MSENQNIDKIFRQASNEFAPQAPAQVWSRLEASLARRRRRLLWWWIAPSALLLTVGLISGIVFFNNNTHILELKNSISKVQYQNSSTQKATDSKINEGRIEHSIDQVIIENNTNNIDKKDILSKPEIKRNTVIEGSPISQKQSVQITEKPTQPSHLAHESKLKNVTEEFAIGLPISNSDIEEVELTKNSSSSEQSIENPIISSEIANVEIKENQESNNQISDTADSEQSVEIIKEIPENKEAREVQKDSFIKKNHTPSIFHFYIAFNLGFGNSGGFYRTPNPTIETIGTTSYLNSEFESSSEISAGFSYGSWLMNLSYKYYDMKGLGDFSMPNTPIKYVPLNYFGVSPIGYYSVENVDNLLESKSYSNVDYLRNFNQTRVNIDITSMNFEIGKFFNYNNWRLILRGGFVSTQINRSIIEANDGTGWQTFGQIHDLKTKIFGLSVGGDIIYQSRKAFYIGLKSDFISHINSINSSEEFGYFPYSYFVGPQIGFRF